MPTGPDDDFDALMRAILGEATAAVSRSVRDRVLQESPRLKEYRESYIQRQAKQLWRSRLLKRCLDLAIAAPLSIVLFPIFLFLPLAIWAVDGRPVFYRRDRSTIFGLSCIIYVFRTMRNDTSLQRRPNWLERLLCRDSHLPSFDPRPTLIGRFLLRPFGLDDLPQLYFTVLSRLSLVGPGLSYRTDQLHRLYEQIEVPELPPSRTTKPAVISLANVLIDQTSVTVNLVRDEYFVDRYYLEHETTWLDLRILGAWGLMRCRIPRARAVQLMRLPSIEECLPNPEVQRRDFPPNQEQFFVQLHRSRMTG